MFIKASCKNIPFDRNLSQTLSIKNLQILRFQLHFEHFLPLLKFSNFCTINTQFFLVLLKFSNFYIINTQFLLLLLKFKNFCTINTQLILY